MVGATAARPPRTHKYIAVVMQSLRMLDVTCFILRLFQLVVLWVHLQLPAF
jgi:hypothetical protein